MKLWQNRVRPGAEVVPRNQALVYALAVASAEFRESGRTLAPVHMLFGNKTGYETLLFRIRLNSGKDDQAAVR